MEHLPQSELFYQIALTQTDLVGSKTARQLLRHFTTAKAIFEAPPKQIAAIEGIGAKTISALRDGIDRVRVERELQFIHKHHIRPLFIADEHYPARLKHCEDAPPLLYYKGSDNILNGKKMVAIVGTRKNTDYGTKMTEDLVTALQQLDVVIVSGLALGIDVIAHRKALQLGIPTIGVMAHGMDNIYPPQHKHIAKEMLQNGGLLTEYASGTPPDKFNFPMRNRIVAGMCDVAVVVETETKGGAMITAKLAASYNREVMAFPGRVVDKKSEGCNYLIRANMATLINNGADLIASMAWETHTKKNVAIQQRLFGHMSDDEKKIADILAQTEGMHIDELQLKSGWGNSRLASLLLTMELAGALKSLPGKRYRMA
ncbi:MAG: DNA-processing protein DprA [Edaphocola sp.]